MDDDIKQCLNDIVDDNCMLSEINRELRRRRPRKPYGRNGMLGSLTFLCRTARWLYIWNEPLSGPLSRNHHLITNYARITDLFPSWCFSPNAAKREPPVNLFSHLRDYKLEEIFQSAYKVCLSTESALLRVHNDVLCALDDGRCVMLVL